MPVSTAVVGRQAITDRDAAVVGYELLFRKLPTSTVALADTDEPISGDQMTISVFFGALGIGVGRLTGGRAAFINADRGILVEGMPVALAPDTTVVEVLESVSIDDEVLAGCRRLKAAGYRLAADDFDWFDGAETLLALMDIVKIDIQALDHDAVEDLVRRCRHFDVKLLAEKVETATELDWCYQLGFDLYQGYHLSRPQTVTSNALNPSQRNVLRLAREVLSDSFDYAAVEAIVRVEPALAYQLVQLASLGRLGETRRPVRSIREALVLMGVDRLRSWLPALMLRPKGRAIDSNLPTILARARMVEILAERQGPGTGGYAFTAGMISGFDLLLGMDRVELMAALDIPAALKADAFGHDTPIARTLLEVIRYQEVCARSDQAGAEMTPLDRVAAQAFAWAMEAVDLIDSDVAA